MSRSPERRISESDGSRQDHGRDAWPPRHYIEEIDRVIEQNYENEKITWSRREDLEKVIRKLESAIKKQFWEKFTLTPFGSSENGFGSIKSDLDVCFKFNYEKNGVARKMDTIRRIEVALASSGFHNVTAITAAKVPIVKFCIETRSGEIEGDISYYNEFALHNTRLLAQYCKWTKDNLLAKLGMFIKRWAKECGIGDASKGSLSSYTYIIMMIHFLQQLQPAPLLPVLQKMRKNKRKRIIVEGRDVSFCDDKIQPNWSSCTLSAGELFIKFLEYYANFDWEHWVVQIRETKMLTKVDKKWTNDMCIEDPFRLNRNLGCGINPMMFAFMLKAFGVSKDLFHTFKLRSQFADKMRDEIEDGEDIDSYGEDLLKHCCFTAGNAPVSSPRTSIPCSTCGVFGHSRERCPMDPNLDLPPISGGYGSDYVNYQGGEGAYSGQAQNNATPSFPPICVGYDRGYVNNQGRGEAYSGQSNGQILNFPPISGGYGSGYINYQGGGTYPGQSNGQTPNFPPISGGYGSGYVNYQGGGTYPGQSNGQTPNFPPISGGYGSGYVNYQGGGVHSGQLNGQINPTDLYYREGGGAPWNELGQRGGWNEGGYGRY